MFARSLVASWDVSSATTMNTMFRDAKLFNSSLADWDTTRVANMGSMYVACRRCTPQGLPAGSRLGLAGRAARVVRAFVPGAPWGRPRARGRSFP